MWYGNMEAELRERSFYYGKRMLDKALSFGWSPSTDPQDVKVVLGWFAAWSFVLVAAPGSSGLFAKWNML